MYNFLEKFNVHAYFTVNFRMSSDLQSLLLEIEHEIKL